MEWFKVNEKMPDMTTEMHGAMVSQKVLGRWGEDDYEVVQCQQEIGQTDVCWFNGIDVVDGPQFWTPITFKEQA